MERHSHEASKAQLDAANASLSALLVMVTQVNRMIETLIHNSFPLYFTNPFGCPQQIGYTQTNVGHAIKLLESSQVLITPNILKPLEEFMSLSPLTLDAESLANGQENHRECSYLKNDMNSALKM